MDRTAQQTPGSRAAQLARVPLQVRLFSPVLKLLLTTDVPGLGGPGDLVEVRDGYGRNFLLPQGKAIGATKGAEKQVATIKRAQLAREIRGTEHANEVKQALENLGGKLKIVARTTGDGTKLFGSITAIDVADAIKSAGGPTLDRRTIDTKGHIKSVGAHPVSVKLHPGVTAQVTVNVVAG